MLLALKSAFWIRGTIYRKKFKVNIIIRNIEIIRLLCSYKEVLKRRSNIESSYFSTASIVRSPHSVWIYKDKYNSYNFLIYQGFLNSVRLKHYGRRKPRRIQYISYKAFLSNFCKCFLLLPGTRPHINLITNECLILIHLIRTRLSRQNSLKHAKVPPLIKTI